LGGDGVEDGPDCGRGAVTPICSEHAALLLGVAKNLRNLTAQQVYADWLQERGNCGWLIVAEYPAKDWPRFVEGQTGWWQQRRGKCWEVWRLPWLQGQVRLNLWTKNAPQRLKLILKAYAEGEVEL